MMQAGQENQAEVARKAEPWDPDFRYSLSSNDYCLIWDYDSGQSCPYLGSSAHLTLETLADAVCTAVDPMSLHLDRDPKDTDLLIPDDTARPAWIFSFSHQSYRARAKSTWYDEDRRRLIIHLPPIVMPIRADTAGPLVFAEDAEIVAQSKLAVARAIARIVDYDGVQQETYPELCRMPTDKPTNIALSYFKVYHETHFNNYAFDFEIILCPPEDEYSRQRAQDLATPSDALAITVPDNTPPPPRDEDDEALMSINDLDINDAEAEGYIVGGDSEDEEEEGTQIDTDVSDAEIRAYTDADLYNPNKRGAKLWAKSKMWFRKAVYYAKRAPDPFEYAAGNVRRIPSYDEYMRDKIAKSTHV